MKSVQQQPWRSAGCAWWVSRRGSLLLVLHASVREGSVGRRAFGSDGAVCVVRSGRGALGASLRRAAGDRRGEPVQEDCEDDDGDTAFETERAVVAGNALRSGERRVGKQWSTGGIDD